MKITLSRDEITEILTKKAQQIGEDCCADDQKVLSVNIPNSYSYSDVITIEIGVPPEPVAAPFQPFTPPSPPADEEEVQF